MRPFRFIHAADLHLDSPFKGLTGLPERLRDAVRDSTLQALNRLVELAVQERVDFIVLAGDIYDAKERSLRAQLRLQQCFEKLAAEGIQVLLIHGNHDPMQDGYTASLKVPDTVTVFGCEAVESVIVRAAGGEPLARVSGMSFAHAAVKDNLALGYRGLGDQGLFEIALLHTNVDGNGEHGNYAPCRLSDLLGRGIDYWALGHVHTRRVLHERPWVVYPGNIQGRHIREQGAKGCYVVDVNAGGEAALTFHALDSWRWEQAELSIAGLESEQQLKEALEEAVQAAEESSDGHSVMLRLTLTGRGALHRMLRRPGALHELTMLLREQGGPVWVEGLYDRTGVLVDREALAAQSGFVGELLRFAEGLRVAENGAELESFSQEALAPLHTHSALSAEWSDGTREELLELLKEAEELALHLLLPEVETGGSE
ncbi:DNA repair exonuclease [Paenibacillus sp. YYML68]|uniref:metallophosphoesterase family protein n=1 Tax=Paenibacillus sp. YYML68 TaxID=2909250 RepID=UPI0024927511|nr:DNA repair exonuclease [Paenibacillus sp. YYML68]